MVIANGAHPELLYDIAAGKPAGTRFTGQRRTEPMTTHRKFWKRPAAPKAPLHWPITLPAALPCWSWRTLYAMRRTSAILAANAEDMAAAKGHISDVMLDRLP